MKKEVEKYYLEEIINLNNKDALNFNNLNDKIINLKECIKNIFNWNGEITFFPNPYYAKKTIFFNYQNLYELYSNQKDKYLHKNLKITYINSLKEIKKYKALIEWTGHITEEVKDDYFLLQEIECPAEKSNQANAFLHTPIKGITILGFKENLKPLYLGSKSVKKLHENSFELSEETESLECGTGNYPLLIYLESCWNHKYEKIKIHENV